MNVTQPHSIISEGSKVISLFTWRRQNTSPITSMRAWTSSRSPPGTWTRTSCGTWSYLQSGSSGQPSYDVKWVSKSFWQGIVTVLNFLIFRSRPRDPRVASPLDGDPPILHHWQQLGLRCPQAGVHREQGEYKIWSKLLTNLDVKWRSDIRYLGRSLQTPSKAIMATRPASK